MAEQVAVNHSIQVRVLTGEPRTKQTDCIHFFITPETKMYATIHAPVVEWYTHQVVALGPLRTMRVRASSYTLILDDKPPPKGRNHLVVKKS